MASGKDLNYGSLAEGSAMRSCEKFGFLLWDSHRIGSFPSLTRAWQAANILLAVEYTHEARAVGFEQ